MAPKISSENSSPFQKHHFDLICSKSTKRKNQKTEANITKSLFALRSYKKPLYAKPTKASCNTRAKRTFSEEPLHNESCEKCEKLANLLFF